MHQDQIDNYRNSLDLLSDKGESGEIEPELHSEINLALSAMQADALLGCVEALNRIADKLS